MILLFRLNLLRIAPYQVKLMQELTVLHNLLLFRLVFPLCLLGFSLSSLSLQEALELRLSRCKVPLLSTVRIVTRALFTFHPN